MLGFHLSKTGPDVAVKLVFNVRVDGARSKIELLMPDASIVQLPAQPQPSPDTLVSRMVGLKAGHYALRWQVLASDGHISRGQIRFTVAETS